MPAGARGGRLKICLASWAPFHAGAEVAGERLATGLAELGHDVSVVLGREGETLESMRKAGLDVTYVPLALTDKWRPWAYWGARHRMAKLLLERAPALVHSNDLPTHQMVSEAARRAGIPRICHHRFVFDGTAIDWMTKFGAERHLFVSRALQDELCRNSTRLARVPGDVLYDGLPIPPLPAEGAKARARARLGLDAEKVLVLFAGQIIERKGVADLLHAWGSLPGSVRARADLVLVGDDLLEEGRYRREMEALARSAGVPARFAGFQRNMPEWLTAADVAVVPSHVEPLGNATLEAMAFRLPVVGSRVGGIPEMVIDEKTGLLVPPRAPDALAGAVTRLVLDRSLREALGVGARARCEQVFSLRAHALAAVAQYEAVLGAGLGAATPTATVVRKR